MYRHILVPLDGSELTSSLVAQAVEFAGSLGARVTFFTMVEDYGATQEGALMRTLSPEAFEKELKHRASAVISDAVAAGQAAQLACEGVVRIGTDPCEEILHVAREKACDLIYMASHGRRGLKALALGSQTHKVLTHSPLPVFVAKAHPSC
ncbi:universal stress protein [Azoarcus sp. PA01]|nr:universal stress protein [Azoarcus sp. PA01]KON82607.1 universal stress protein [Azoarcus sp. PA01]